MKNLRVVPNLTTINNYDSELKFEVLVHVKDTETGDLYTVDCMYNVEENEFEFFVGDVKTCYVVGDKTNEESGKQLHNVIKSAGLLLAYAELFATETGVLS